MGWDGGPGLDGCGSTIRTHIPATTAPFGHLTSLTLRSPQIETRALQKKISIFLLEAKKKTLTDHPEHLCLCTCSLRPARFFFWSQPIRATTTTMHHRSHGIRPSAAARLLFVTCLLFLFFSVCSTRSSFSRFRVDSTIDSPAGGRHTFVPARQQGNHAENFQIQ